MKAVSAMLLSKISAEANMYKCYIKDQIWTCVFMEGSVIDAYYSIQTRALPSAVKMLWKWKNSC